VRILFATSHFGFLRNVEPALHLLAERGHHLHLVADRKDKLGGIRIVENLARTYPHITHAWVPTSKRRTWHALGTAFRLSLDYWRYLHPRYDRSPKLKQRARLQAPRTAVTVGSIPVLRTRVGVWALNAVVKTMERTVPYDPVVRQLLEDQRPDVLLITPLLYFGSSQVDYVRAARALGIPSVLSVGSWDHLTTKGLIHEVPDRVIVWNDIQRREAWDIHGVPPAKVTVTGAQAYDRWFSARPSTSRDEFCGAIGLDPTQPILLYLCSSPFITPVEVGFVERWVQSIRSCPDPCLRQAGLLIRPHPQNFEQWANVDLTAHGNVAIFPRGGANPIDSVARAEYFDSMYHAAAVVGVNTSALIESGIVGRPVHTVLTKEFADTQEGTLHFRHLENVNGGLLRSACDLDEHLGHLVHTLRVPEGSDMRSRGFIEAFIRPQGLDRPAAPIFADAVEDAVRRGVKRSTHDPVWGRLVRGLLYPVAFGAKWLAARRRAARGDLEQRSTDSLRILFVMASPEYLRYYDSTIRLLIERGHRLIIGVNQQRDVKQARLEELGDVTGDVEIVGVIPKRSDLWGQLGKGLRGVVDFTRFLHPRYRYAPALRARMKRKVLPHAFKFLDWIPSLGSVGVQVTLAGLAWLERAIPSSRELEGFIASHDPDLVLVSPLIDAASDQVDLIKSAQARGVRTGACIASWDNLTNKGLMRIEPDLVFVWNEIQRGEAVTFHRVTGDKVAVTGAQLFDRWFERRSSRSRRAFCAEVGLRSEKPFVLFTCSSGFISESHREVPFVRAWIAALRGSMDPTVRELGVLVRPHPYNTAAWETADLSDLSNVAVYPRQRFNPVEEARRATYFDSLYYSAAVVGINTSAMIEAAIVGRPVLSIVTPEFAGTQEGTLHFHYLLPESGGCVRVASSFGEHVSQLAYALAHEDVTRAETERFVHAFIRPHGLTRPSTPVFVEHVERLAQQGVQRPIGTPVWGYPLRLVLVVVGAMAGLIAVVVTPRTWRRLKKWQGRALHRLRKRANKTARGTDVRFRRSTKRLGRTMGAPGLHYRSRWFVTAWKSGIVRPAHKLRRLVRRGRYQVAMLVKHRQ